MTDRAPEQNPEPAGQVGEKIPHSGHLPREDGGERPNYEFDPRDLLEAIKEGKYPGATFNPETGKVEVNVPDTVEAGQALEPTSTPPTEHNVPLIATEAPRTRHIGKIAGAIAGFAAVVGGGVWWAASANSGAAKPTPSASAPSNPGPSPSTIETPTLSPEEQEQLELAKLAAKDKEDAEKFASLDIEDFQNLSLESRLKRVNYYYYQIANLEIPPEYFDQKLTQSITLGDKNPIFESTSLSNGEDIIWFSMFAEQAIDTAGAKETDSGSANRDMTMASQLTGGVAFDMKSEYGKELIEFKTGENDKKTGRIPEDQIPETKSYTKPKEMVIDGKTYKYREITNTVGGKTYIDTMVAVPSKLTIQNPDTGKFETLEFTNWLRNGSKEIKNPR